MKSEVDSERALSSEVDSNPVSARPHATIVDSYILHEDTVGCSDHCPVGLVIRI